MRKTILGIFCFAALGSAQAQINYAGQPHEWDIKETAEVDMDLVKAQDAVTDRYKETSYRFGIENEVDLDFFELASSETQVDGSTIYRLGFHCPEATSINFLIDDFFIPEGGELYIWNADRTEYLGAFTHESNKDSRMFPIGLIQTDRVVMEYIRQAGTAQLETIHIAQVVHGYRTILNKWDNKGPFGTSGACNINVNCPQGDPWEDQIQSVALIVQGGNAVCSGAMIGNTAGDDTPYFLTADHCLGNPASWTYHFNHEAASCVGSNGPLSTSISGGTLLESNPGSDMALIELSSAPPETYNAYYAGWNKSTSQNAASSAVGVHHPSGDVKKICFEEDNPGFSVSSGVSVWLINNWEEGVTEGGSSGSPLFNEDGLIVGQLLGGAAACNGNVNNGQFDVYGRFGVSYPFIEEWLDPAGNNGNQFEGYYPGVISVEENDLSLDVQVFPNPSQGQLNITSDDNLNFDIRVLDMTGKVCFVSSPTTETVVQLDLTDLDAGMYLIELSAEKGRAVKRFCLE